VNPWWIVHQISENFDWSKFAPGIVAPVEGGQFAIVDGQHRTTMAILRSQEKMPCQVVQADRAKQAAAYAATGVINVSSTSALKIRGLKKLDQYDPHYRSGPSIAGQFGEDPLPIS
jgi:ParB-like nuclease domain